MPASLITIAIAGTGGLARAIAFSLEKHYEANLPVFLSHSTNSELTEQGFQVVTVDYTAQEDLLYALKGINLVISTISGPEQINLIDAASRAKVQRFVPSEFQGPPEKRPADSYFDKWRHAALTRLRNISSGSRRHRMDYTVFVCGIFYERFLPGGLAEAGLALETGWERPGMFLLNINQGTADIPEKEDRTLSVKLCLTGMDDAARFIVGAIEQLELKHWPTEFKMRGERLSISQIVKCAERLVGAPFDVTAYKSSAIRNWLAHAMNNPINEYGQDIRAKYELINATLKGEYDYTSHNLNDLVTTHRPASFENWLRGQW